MLERVHRAWDRLHQRQLTYRRVTDGGGGDHDEDATAEAEDPAVDEVEDWRPMMTASLYCPGPDGEPPPSLDCRRSAEGRRPSADGDWCSLTLGRTPRRCRCRCAAATAATHHSEPSDTLPSGQRCHRLLSVGVRGGSCSRAQQVRGRETPSPQIFYD